MKHEEIRHKLSEFIDGAITPGEKADIEQHLKTCTECSDALRELRKTIEHIHAIDEVESPAWMTQKIMAKVREEQETKNSDWQRFFAPILQKFPVQAVAVLFLAVTAYFIYININPAQKYTEEPVGMLAKKETPEVGRMKEEDKAVREAAPKPDQAPQKPGYKSLDMKYEYEKPAAPVPAAPGGVALATRDLPPASAPAPGKGEAQSYAQDKAYLERRSASPKAASPSVMAEQAAPAAGAVQSAEARRKAVSEDHNAKDTLPADREADARLDIIEHFGKFDLPASMKVKGLTYTIRKFEPGPADQVLMETSSHRFKLCSNRYVVDVDLSGKFSKYLYCYDKSQITLLGIYEVKQGGWTEMK